MEAAEHLAPGQVVGHDALLPLLVLKGATDELVDGELLICMNRYRSAPRLLFITRVAIPIHPPPIHKRLPPERTFFISLPMRESRRLLLILEVTLALIDLGFFLPATRLPRVAAMVPIRVWGGVR